MPCNAPFNALYDIINDYEHSHLLNVKCIKTHDSVRCNKESTNIIKHFNFGYNDNVVNVATIAEIKCLFILFYY